MSLRSVSLPKGAYDRIILPYLEHLTVCDTDLTNFTALHTWNAPRLHHIFLTRHVLLKDFKGIDPWLNKLESLSFTNIELHSFEGLSDKPLPHLLYLTFNCVFSDQALEALSTLDLSSVKKLKINISLHHPGKHTSRSNEYITLKNFLCFPPLNFPKGGGTPFSRNASPATQASCNSHYFARCSRQSS